MSFLNFGYTATNITIEPEESAERVLWWKLDGDGAEEVQALDLTLSGTPEVVADSLLGDAEQSLGFDGVDDKCVAVDDAAFDLTTWTVVVTCQPDTSPSTGQRSLVGKGTFSNDEFQIEQRTPGKLRAHTGASAVFLGTSAGTVDLTVEVAHQIALIGRGEGVELWHRAAGDSWAMAASHSTPTTLGFGTGSLYIGGSPYGGNFFDGVIKGVEIWDRDLSLAQLDELPAPTTITHDPDPGVESDEPLLPEFEWLVSDEATPAATKYVSNQNRGTGSGNSAANAQELQTALTAASAGQTFIAVCQTPGATEYWDYQTGLTFNSGTSGNPITLQAREGDAVVISGGETWAGARTTGSGFWTQSGLSQADIDKKIWRSSATYSLAAENIIGWWFEFGHPHQIVRANSMTNLRAIYGTADSPTNYAGPCVHKDTDGRVYLRFQRPHPDKYSFGGKWSANTWPGHPEAVNASGQLVYPVSEDPNDYEIYLCRATTTLAFSPGASGGFIKIGSGINSVGYRDVLIGHDITMRRGTHLCWRFFVRSGDSAVNKRSQYDIQRVRASDGAKIHLARSEWKFGGWHEGIRSCFVEGNASDSLTDMHFKDCTICDFHEILVAGFLHERFRFRNCTFWHIYDDGIQAFNPLSQVEIGYCWFLGSAWGGMGTNGVEGNDPTPGNWFIHHNIWDLREERCTNWRAQPHPVFPYLSHSPDGDKPMKIYNNLMIYGPDTENEVGPGFAHCSNDTGGGRNNALTGTSNAHEIFNNIILRVSWGTRYDPNAGGVYTDVGDRSDYVIDGMNCDPSQSNEFWDYNLYYRDIEGTLVDSFFMRFRTGESGSFQAFSSLANFQASALFNTSKGSGSMRGAYAAGFEANSTSTAPTMPSLDNFPGDRFKYRPSATAAVTTAASSSLSGANWWTSPPSWGDGYFDWNDGAQSLAPDDWKGPLDPNGSTMTVGVLDP